MRDCRVSQWVEIGQWEKLQGDSVVSRWVGRLAFDDFCLGNAEGMTVIGSQLLRVFGSWIWNSKGL